MVSTLKGLWQAPSTAAATPSGLQPPPNRVPRVARSSQPWAGGRNPFGIGNAWKLRPTSLSAFSLIEVLVAILILGVALAGLTRGLTTALGSSKESEVHTTAAMIAAAQIESLRAEGGILDGETEGSYGGGLALYQWKQTISPTQIEGLHDVKVTIASSRTGQTIYELQTLLFEPTADTTTKEKDKKRGKKRGGRG